MATPATTCPRCARPLPADARYCLTCGARVHGVPRALRRRRDLEKLGGVCAGLAEYFDVDPTFVRAVYTVITFFTGIVPGVVLYVILALVVPAE
jgi:phage shock protein C